MTGVVGCVLVIFLVFVWFGKLYPWRLGGFPGE